jgi:hypothetical protein
MLEKMHEHLIAEVEQGNRTDTIVVVVAVLFNVIALCSNSTVAIVFTSLGANEVSDLAINLYLVVFVLLTVGLNIIAVAGLLIGRKMREKLLVGLVAMYSDNQVNKYYDQSLINSYRIRYLVFGGIMVLFALASIVLPLILRLL